jgi:ABC-type polysaccharide/polyol phosphate transport system ATPase subunit
LQAGECLALIGHNGSGKSTLLKTLVGIISPTHGRVVTKGRVASLIELGAGFDGELSGEENIFLACTLMGLSKKQIQQNIQSILQFAELEEFAQFPLKNYSSGMYARLGFSCATLLDPDILIVDEVLAVGDEKFQAKCLKRIEDLKKLGKSIVFVTHDMNAVTTFCDRVVLLDHGSLVYDGRPEIAINLFRKLMMGVSSQELLSQLNNRVSEQHKEGSAEVVSGRVEGKGLNICEPGKKFELKVQFMIAHHPKEKLVCGVAFYESSSKTRLGGINSLGSQDAKSQNVSVLEVKPNVLEFCFKFQSCPLNVGSYYIETLLYDASSREFYAHAKNIVEFSVEGNSLAMSNADNDFIAFGAFI